MASKIGADAADQDVVPERSHWAKGYVISLCIESLRGVPNCQDACHFRMYCENIRNTGCFMIIIDPASIMP